MARVTIEEKIAGFESTKSQVETRLRQTIDELMRVEGILGSARLEQLEELRGQIEIERTARRAAEERMEEAERRLAAMQGQMEELQRELIQASARLDQMERPLRPPERDEGVDGGSRVFGVELVQPVPEPMSIQTANLRRRTHQH